MGKTRRVEICLKFFDVMKKDKSYYIDLGGNKNILYENIQNN
jgi:hypothetical protein